MPGAMVALKLMSVPPAPVLAPLSTQCLAGRGASQVRVHGLSTPAGPVVDRRQLRHWKRSRASAPLNGGARRAKNRCEVFDEENGWQFNAIFSNRPICLQEIRSREDSWHRLCVKAGILLRI